MNGAAPKRGLKMKILHSVSYKENQDLLNDLQSASQDYQSRISALKQFRKTKQVKQKSNQHQTEWLLEHERLKQIHFKMQQEIDDHFRAAISINPECSGLYDVLELQQNNKKEIQSLCTLLSAQLEELRQFLKQCDVKTDKAEQDNTIANAVVADVFVQYRNNHSHHWQELHAEEILLRGQVAEHSRHILKLIHQDNLQSQESQFNEDLMSILREEGSTDDEEISYSRVEVMDLVKNWHDKLSSLDQEHCQVMKQKQEEKQTFCSELGVENNAYKGWESSDHDIFVKIFKKAHSTGMKRKLMMDLLIAQLPAKTMDDILLHEEWYRKMKFITNKYKDIESTYRTSRQDLIENARVAIRAFQQEMKQQAQEEKAAEERERRRIELQIKLLGLRQQKAEEMQHELEVLREKQVELAAMQEEERKLWETERQQKKELVSAFQKQREDMLVEQERKKTEQEAEAARILKELIDNNRSKVEFRAQQFYTNLQKKKLEEVSTKYLFFPIQL
ncbi:hypothetical protein EON65_06130 [archaeon]|nr:MAG: hypothetical protein EON65_06130 [archaeon]